MIITSREEFLSFFAKKKIALLPFNKDARNFLRFVGTNFNVPDITIPYIFDLTLGFRPGVKAIAEEVSKSSRIVSDAQTLQEVIDKRLVDIILCFDRFGLKYTDRKIDNLQQCQDWLMEDYNSYTGESKTAQYNFRWRLDIVDYINVYAARKGIHIVSAYWDDLFPRGNRNIPEKDGTSPYFTTVDMLSMVESLRDFDPMSVSAKVNFVLGTDWGGGKTTFLFNRMKEGHLGIASDAWFALVSDYFMPMFMSGFAIKGYVMNQIMQAWTSHPDKEIYVKFGGRLEEYVYGIPVDRRMYIENMHKFFDQVKFYVVLKQSESIAEKRKLLLDLKNQYGLIDNLLLYRMYYDGREEKIIEQI